MMARYIRHIHFAGISLTLTKRQLQDFCEHFGRDVYHIETLLRRGLQAHIGNTRITLDPIGGQGKGKNR